MMQERAICSRKKQGRPYAIYSRRLEALKKERDELIDRYDWN